MVLRNQQMVTTAVRTLFTNQFLMGFYSIKALFLFSDYDISTTSVTFQCVYKAFAGEFHNVFYYISHSLDQVFFEYMQSMENSLVYKFNAEIYEFNLKDDEWFTNIEMNFYENIQVTNSFYDGLVDAFSSPKLVAFNAWPG